MKTDGYIRNRFTPRFGKIIAGVAASLNFLLLANHGLLAQTADFQRQIASLLVSNCLECHSGSGAQGGLDVSGPETLAAGGDSGRAVVAGSSAESLLWERIRDDEMPPQHPLSNQEKEIIREWIDQGASWTIGPIDLFSMTTDKRAGRDWWSLQPLNRVTVPSTSSDWVRNDIDRFVLRRLGENKLNPSPVAFPRDLIRRLYFDLTGLPPSPEEVARFVADPSDDNYRQLVDRLLDSPHYGERWGRHWLDVVRYGESDGFERNAERKNAWYYRDWVIEALNADTPYDEFVRMQLIGDLLTDDISGVAATGFWVAGVHNTVVGGSRRMQLQARQDEIEEVLGTIGQTFTGLTFNCARCHDHKFDPVSQIEYYQLASAISGLGFGERTVANQAEQNRIDEPVRRLANLKNQLSKISQSARQIILNRRSGVTPQQKHDSPYPVSLWEFDNNLNDSIGNLHGISRGSEQLEDGALVLDGESFVETTPLQYEIRAKSLEVCVQLDNLYQQGGAAIAIDGRDGEQFDALVFGEIETGRWMAGSDFFRRTDSFSGDIETEAVSRPVHLIITHAADGTINCYRDGQPYGRSIRKSDLQPFAAGESVILFGLRHRPGGNGRFLKGKIHRAALYDRALTAGEAAVLAAGEVNYISGEELIAAMDPGQRKRYRELENEIEKLSATIENGRQQVTCGVYSLVPGMGEITSVAIRGDPETPGEVVRPGATSAVKTLSADFLLEPDAPESERRRKLAAWITDPANPLFARVIVNRVWHYHFGEGIVETPNDFGFNGGRPSHPDLLDYLAIRFQQDGYRLKSLHRLIVNSATWRQSAFGLPVNRWRESSSVDSSNRLLWRGPSGRLDAESLRDAMLMTSGVLNLKAGGPGFRDVEGTFNNGTTYYEPVDGDSPEFFRRTVYRFIPRGERSALLETFDCPDPAFTAPRRSSTTTPLQSLSLMNNSLVLQLSEYFAKRVEREVGDDVSTQVNRAWQLAIARDPDPEEFRLSEQLVRQHGLPALCRGLFNCNEFVLIQ